MNCTNSDPSVYINGMQQIIAICKGRGIPEIAERLKQVKDKFTPEFITQFQPETALIMQSFQGIQNFKGKFSKKNPKFIAFLNQIEEMIDSISIFTNFITLIKGKRYEFEMDEIFRRLFKMSFHPPQDDNSYETLVYPVYNIFFDFFNMNSNIINFKSSTGSGKTRCAPFMFSILSYYEELKMPFFIMTQPGKTIIDDKVEDFTNFFGDTVILETDPKKYLEYYKQQNITKPIIGLFSPRSLLVLISKSFKKHIKIFDRTRFCLDEIHERDCHTDAVISELAENCPKYKIKKHIMMMSATPDNRIFDVFREDGIEIKELHLKEKCLFPIKDVIVKVDNVNNIATTAVNNAIQIIDNMTTNTSIQGHILIFSSGRQRILEIYDLFLSSIKEFISNEKKREEEKRREFNEKRKGKKKKQKEQTPEFLFQKVGILLDCEEALNDEQKFYQYIKENVTDKNKLYILPIPFLSYVSNFQKHIAKSNITNYDNIIKVVIATNAIESSITIDNMAAVIDCGICNTPEFNSLTGIINLKESQITKQNQMQRRGRVGRVMPGTAVQITVEGEIIPDYQEPEILTSDISAFILDLRRIGIRFENLKKLPNEVPLETVQSKINILKNIGALDLTTGNLTKKGLKLSSFRNFSPFISASIMNLSNKYYEGNYIPMILAALVIKLISGEIIQNNLSKMFVKNFNVESDVDTIMKTFIEMVNTRKKIKDVALEYGFIPKKATQIVGEIFELCQMLEKGKKDELWPSLTKFYSDCQFVHVFCSRLFEEIRSNSENGIWIIARKAELDLVSNTLFEPEFRFKADKCLAFNSNEGYIVTRSRPGSFSFNIPSNVLILNIARNANLKINFGSIIHIDLTQVQNYKPFAINIPNFYNTPFFIPMLNGFVSKYQNYMLKFNQIGSALKAKESDICFAFSSLLNNKEICLNSFIKADKYEKVEMKIREGIQIVQDLAPFTPQTILIIHPYMKCCCALKGYGIDKIDNDIISFDEPEYKAYHVNENTLRYMHSKISELSKQSSTCSIAITGEDMSFSFDQTVKFEGNKKFVSFPHANQKCNSVFSIQKDFSHLVIISKEEICLEQSLTWQNVQNYQQATIGDISASNYENIFPNGVKIFYNPWINFYPDTYLIKYIQKKKVEEEYDDLDEDSKSSFKIINIIDFYANQCVHGEKLIKDVEFELQDVLGKCNFGKAIGLRSHLMKTKQLPSLEKLKSIKNVIEDALMAPFSLIPDLRSLNIDKRLHNLSIVYQQIALAKLFNLKFAHSVKFLKNCITIKIKNTENNDENIAKISKILRSFNVHNQEILPTYEVYIKHLSVYKLSEEEFTEKVHSVLDHFGGTIFEVSKYYESKTKNSHEKGIIIATVCSKEFLQPLITMLRDQFSNEIILNIPETVIPSYLTRYREVLNALTKYFEAKKIPIKNINCDFYGTKNDVERAEQELLNDPPHLPITIVNITPDINTKSLEIALRTQSVPWKFNKRNKILIVPEDVKQETIMEFIEKYGRKDLLISKNSFDIPNCFGDDILCHGDQALQSNESINLYFPNKSIVSRPVCLQCAKETIAFNLGRIVDQNGHVNVSRAIENSEHIDIYSFYEPTAETDKKNGIWPTTPFGHLIWILLSSTISKKETKAYITALAALAFHKSPMFTYCPNHPDVFIKINQYGMTCCQQKNCNMIKCNSCGKWHPAGKCENLEIPAGCRQCPFCQNIVEKSQDCNHIKCSCGKHFCYYCGKGFDTDGEVYNHMNTADHIYDPPDYLKFVLHQNIPEANLREFYNKFPIFRTYIYRP